MDDDIPVASHTRDPACSAKTSLGKSVVSTLTFNYAESLKFKPRLFWYLQETVLLMTNKTKCVLGIFHDLLNLFHENFWQKLFLK